MKFSIKYAMVYKLNNISILLVEDLQPMLALTKSILNIFGLRNITTAQTVKTAYSLFKSEKHDLVITDWIMEPQSGLDLINMIRHDPASPNPYVPIILMTGYSDRRHVEEARDKGVTEFLMKPFSARDLYGRIAQVIEKPRQFVETGEFFGPDRRRRKNIPYTGKDRRGDAPRDDVEFEGIEVDLVIRDIQNTLKKM